MFTKNLVFKDIPVDISFTSTLSVVGEGGGGRGVLGVRGGVVAQCAPHSRLFDHSILTGGAMKLIFYNFSSNFIMNM